MSASYPSRAEEPDPGNSWLFYRTSSQGRPVFAKELDKLPEQAVASLIGLMGQYVAGQLSPGGLKVVRDDIWELRWRQGNNRFRVLFFRWGSHPVALTAFQKKQQKTPKTRITAAIERKKNWVKVFGETP